MGLLLACAMATLLSCSPAALSPPVTQAEAVSESKAAEEAKEFAPQAFARAEKLRAEARFLHREKRPDESAAAGEQALAAYEVAFALSRRARAEQRHESARKQLDQAQAKVDELDALHARINADAERFELQARVHLDTEETSDVAELSAERALARRTVALRLASDARVLCHAAQLLEHDTAAVERLTEQQAKLDADLSSGSVRKDMYPRASTLRADCLRELTRARRPVAESHPEEHASDELLEAIAARGDLMVYRDDRGIVVNLGGVLGERQELTPAVSESLEFLGQVAGHHPKFPLMLVVHTAKKGDDDRAELLERVTRERLVKSGAQEVRSVLVGSTQPAVFSSVQGSDSLNERVEVIFVQPGR